MKTFISFLGEENDPPAPEQSKQNNHDPLRNPGALFNSFKEALTLAKRQAEAHTALDDRAYIMKNIHATQQGVKPYIVIYNKILLSQDPNWADHGFSIQGWVSVKDGVVIKNRDGSYVKDVENKGNEQ